MTHFRVAMVDSSTQDVHPLRPDMVTIILHSSEWATFFKAKTKQALFSEIYERVQSQKIKQEFTNIFK